MAATDTKRQTRRPMLVTPEHRCGAVEDHLYLVRTDPEYRWRRRALEAELREWVCRFAGEGLRTGLVRIPVVVHVVHHTAAENISDAQIASQIDVLNADFRRLNADRTQTPAAFSGVAADARIEFRLAVRDPDCNPTTGITRTSTTVTGWTRTDQGMKATATGGHDPWDVTSYLNVWVVNYTDGLLGKGAFPGGPAALDGITCHYRAFGSTGTLAAPYDRGRTLTHEVGHYLNLFHIWGSAAPAGSTDCTDTDAVADTPNQAGARFGAPTFPQVSCSNGPNGDMFMNFMDYTDDAAMNLFTADQVTRMQATLSTARSGLLASDALVPPTGTPDLWMQDVSDDTGAEPDVSAQPMWISDDIWVRTANDGIANQDHQNPLHRPGGGSNFVYVRVRNRGCGGVLSGTLRLHWAKASTGLSWPAPWDGSVTTPAVMGGPIGSAPVSVTGSGDTVVTFPWAVPDPADYASFGADRGHFCLLARLETGPAPAFGMTSPEGPDLEANVRANNGIVWKNVTVVEEGTDGPRESGVVVANHTRERVTVSLVFADAPTEASVFEFGTVDVQLGPGLLRAWRRGKESAEGLERLAADVLRVEKAGARLGPLTLPPGFVEGLTVRFTRRNQRPLGARVFAVDVVQLAGRTVVGGQRFLVKTRADQPADGQPHDRPVFDGVGWWPPDGACGCR